MNTAELDTDPAWTTYSDRTKSLLDPERHAFETLCNTPRERLAAFCEGRLGMEAHEDETAEDLAEAIADSHPHDVSLQDMLSI